VSTEKLHTGTTFLYNWVYLAFGDHNGNHANSVVQDSHGNIILTGSFSGNLSLPDVAGGFVPLTFECVTDAVDPL